MIDTSTLEKLLVEQGKTLVTAESCTGGLLAELLTRNSGASNWFLGGWVTYSNDMKQNLLDVDATLIKTHGAVSYQVARAMCCGALQKGNTNAALSVTGIAGPTGGTNSKPVGTVFIGCANDTNVHVREFRFGGNRHECRQSAASLAIEILTRELQGNRVDIMCNQFGDIFE